MVPTQTAAASTRWLIFWWKKCTGTDSRSVARLHFELFCKPKLSHPDFEHLYNNWIKDSLLFLPGDLSRNLEEQMLIFQVWEQQQLERRSLVVVCTNLMVHQVIAPKGKELYVVLVFKNLCQNRFHCSCNMHRYGALNFDLWNTEQKHIVIHFPSFNSRRDCKIFV